jgi:hypothetical protein
MPDIQTAFKAALSKTLQQWDDDGEAPLVQPVSNPLTKPTQEIPMKKTFNVSNNISRVSFEYVKNNPGSTRKEIIEALDHQGFNSGSTSSLIAQMRRNKLIHETNGAFYADVAEYRPLKSLKAIKKLEGDFSPAWKRKYEKKDTVGIGALLKERLDSTPTPIVIEHPSPKQRGFMTTLVRTRSPEDILKDMTVYQARELYDHLKQMFGG